MNRRELLVAAISIAVLAGCSESTGPHIPSSAIRVEPLVPMHGTGVRETEVANPPAVRITYFSSGKAISGRPVVFTVDTGGGPKANVTVLTDTDGVARLPGWRLGRDLGRYAVTAVTDGWGPITFSVIVPGDVVAIYDLQTIDGKPAGSEAHLVLYEIGLHNDFVGGPAKGFTIAAEALGSYARLDDDRILFSPECKFVPAQCDARWLVASVSGTELIVDYVDEWTRRRWVEVYALRAVPGGI